MNAGSRNQAWRPSAKPQASQSLYRIEITFDDNRKLADVLGEFDVNLALIENKLGLKAVAHGNVVVLDGDKETCLQGKEVLETLYQRARSGAALTQGDVEGTIRHLSKSANASTPGISTPAPVSVVGELKTRKRTVLARTPNRVIFMNRGRATVLTMISVSREQTGQNSWCFTILTRRSLRPGWPCSR